MRLTSFPASRNKGPALVSRFLSLFLGAALLGAVPLLATSVIPITVAELYQRADVIVHGVVVTSDATVDELGRPETMTVIEPIDVLKGRLAGSLVLHQLGGTLPDGRFFKLWGRPEYAPGREVVVFAIGRPEGEYQTAEMMLGKFEVWQDQTGGLFAVPDLAAGVHTGVEVHASGGAQDDLSPRELARFLGSLRTGVFDTSPYPKPSGTLAPVHHPKKTGGVTPQWGMLSDLMFRWGNDATATWTISGTANMDGGGMAEALAALATWTNDPNSNINYTAGSGSSKILYLNAVSSTLGCGWSTCLTGGGVIGCGGVTDAGGTNTVHGETYTTITRGTVELRASCIHNGFGSVVTQTALTHELGHTLGLGHSDQNVSPHDICRGDEDAAIMRSSVPGRTALGTDDQDAIRWLYGDGGNSCGASGAGVSGDFNGDGMTDIVWHNTSTGENAIWYMNGLVVTGGGAFAPAPTAWMIVGIGDFNSDGRPDIVWRNSNTGENAIWYMGGSGGLTVLGGAAFASAPTQWAIVAIEDFNHDGKPDILWRNATTGQNAVWYMGGSGGTSVMGAGAIGSASPAWVIAGVGDFNGDGHPDIVWRNSSTGEDAIWYMSGTSVIGGGAFATIPGTWAIEAVGDFNGDGNPDIAWRNTSTGEDTLWFMNGTTVIGGGTIGSVPTAWSIVGPK